MGDEKMPDWGNKATIEEKKLFLGQLVWDNFHIFGKDARNIIGGAFWRHYRERLDVTILESNKKDLS